MRVRRRRGIHVLMGTLALVAGCSTAHRAEVSGTVRDRSTGRVIAGARVVGADGSLAETDADGRFHLWVRGEHADVRISAAGHSSEHVEIEGLEANVELAPIDETWGQESTHVLAFVEETWTLDGGAGDAAIRTCPETSLAQAHSEIACASCHEANEAIASCASCHAAEAAAIRGASLTTRIASHDGLGGGCLACHGEIAHGEASRACARCHGSEASTRTAELGTFFALATSATSAQTSFEMQTTAASADVARWARALAVDRSGGAHDPDTTFLVGRARASALGREARVADGDARDQSAGSTSTESSGVPSSSPSSTSPSSSSLIR